MHSLLLCPPQLQDTSLKSLWTKYKAQWGKRYTGLEVSTQCTAWNRDTMQCLVNVKASARHVLGMHTAGILHFAVLLRGIPALPTVHALLRCRTKRGTSGSKEVCG